MKIILYYVEDYTCASASSIKTRIKTNNINTKQKIVYSASASSIKTRIKTY